MENLPEGQVVLGPHLIKGELPIDCASLNLSFCLSKPTYQETIP